MTKPFQPDMSGCIDIAEHHPDLGIWVAFEDDKVWLSRDDWEKVMARNEELARRLDEAKAEIERMRPVVEALRPFTHPDLCKELGGNSEGDNSPVYGRDAALLRLGHFRNAAKSMREYEEGK